MMPGKVNPVIAESTLMACAQVVGHDATIAWCCAWGNFELNAMMPLIAYNLLDSAELLTATTENFLERCVRGLEVDQDRASWYAGRSLANATALVPVIGYDRASAIAQEAYRRDSTIEEIAVEKSGLPKETLQHLLNPKSQTGRSAPGISGLGPHLLSLDEKVDLMSKQSFPASDPPGH